MKIRSIFIGTLIAVVITITVILIMSAISYFTDMSSSIAAIVTYFGAAIGVFAGAAVAARTCNGKVLVNSIAVSILFMLIMIITSYIVSNTVNFDMHFLAMLLGSIIAGFLGAVVGR